MTIGGIIAIGFLLTLVVLVLRGIRGHGHADKSGADSAGGGDETASGGD